MNFLKRVITLITICALYLASVAPIFIASKSFAGNSPTLIRDAEIEKFLRDLSRPLIKAAGLNVDEINFYVIDDKSINAFVSSGQNVFINTGLILQFDSPDPLIGVIAHELGHIAGGHLARSGDGERAAMNAMLLSYLLGIGAMLGGSPQAGQALIMGGSQTANRMFMNYTRGQEEAADRLALVYLDRVPYTANGLLEVLQLFEREAVGQKIDEFAQSHPISQKRVEFIKAHTENKPIDNKVFHDLMAKTLQIVSAKIEAFTSDPDFIIEKYRNQKTLIANYETSIALFRKGETKKSISMLDGIIKDRPEDGFLYELRGQILFESGKAADSVISYNQALKLLNGRDAVPSQIGFAEAILAFSKNDKQLIQLAINKLEAAKKIEDDNRIIFRDLADAYNKIGDDGRYNLALAEIHFLDNQKEKTIEHAKKAKEILNKNPQKNKADLIEAQDLIALAGKIEKKKKE